MLCVQVEFTHFEYGDVVRVSEDMAAVSHLQLGHGEWTSDMALVGAWGRAILLYHGTGGCMGQGNTTVSWHWWVHGAGQYYCIMALVGAWGRAILLYHGTGGCMGQGSTTVSWHWWVHGAGQYYCIIGAIARPPCSHRR